MTSARTPLLSAALSLASVMKWAWFGSTLKSVAYFAHRERSFRRIVITRFGAS
jgi:hypothetical protein